MSTPTNVPVGVPTVKVVLPLSAAIGQPLPQRRPDPDAARAVALDAHLHRAEVLATVLARAGGLPQVWQWCVAPASDYWPAEVRGQLDPCTDRRAAVAEWVARFRGLMSERAYADVVEVGADIVVAGVLVRVWTHVDAGGAS